MSTPEQVEHWLAEPEGERLEFKTASNRFDFDKLTDYVRTAKVNGRALKDDPLIRDRIGALAADIEVARQFQIRNTQMVEQGRVPIYEAAVGKVFTGELHAVNALAPAPDGALIATDGSSVRGVDDWALDLMELGQTGRVFRLDPKTGAATQLASGLGYAFGAVASARTASTRSAAW